MNKKTKIILIVIIALFILGMALYPKIKTYIKTENDGNGPIPSATTTNANRNRPLNVNAMVLKYQNLDDIFTNTGSLIPDEEVNLSFETSGKITEIFFKEGSNAKKGQLLAKINDKPLQAELKKLEAQVPLAQDRVSRQKALLAKDAVSQEAYESVTTELEKLKADIELVKAKIEQTELRAPFDGVIGLRHVSEGAYVSPSTIIVKLSKISPLKVVFSINEKHAEIVKVGTNVNFTLEDEGKIFEGHAQIYALESNLDANTFTLDVRALYPNSNKQLQPGRFVNVEVKLREIKNTLVVPSISIIPEMGRDIAFVYKNGKAHQVTLTKGMRTASSVQIVEGLNIGDTLLVTGVMQLRDGLPVIIDNFIENE